jgi:sodium/bile acid cotransporter 7
MTFLANPDLRLGLLVTSVVPCTLGSALIWTRMADGNDAVALVIIVLTTCLSCLVTTAWLTAVTTTTVEIRAIDLMESLFAVLVVPIALGQAVRATPGLAAKLSRFKGLFGVASQLLIFSVIVRGLYEATSSHRAGVAQLASAEVVASIATTLAAHLAAVVVGIAGSRLAAFDRPTTIAVALGGSQKTLPVGLYLIQTYFPQHPLAIVPILAYHVGQLVVDSLVVEHWRRGNPRPFEGSTLNESPA